MLNIRTTRTALLWCSIINYGLLVLWFLLFISMHDWLIRSWSKWFRLSPEQFDFLNFGGMLLLKLFILVFNFIPFIALLIVGRASAEGAVAGTVSRKEN